MSDAAARLLKERAPLLDTTLASYLDGYLRDASSVVTCELDDGVELESFLRPTFEDFPDDIKNPEGLIAEIKSLLMASGSNVKIEHQAKQLDQVIDLKALNRAATTLSTGIDISSTTKARTTQVDLKKLEKQEDKIKAKANKRAKKTGIELYEGSKLIDAKKRQEEYEELFMQVNPLSSFGNAAKGKSKDIHLENIDLSFGSLRILTGASLTLAAGRRYGLIGRNGIGKSTLLKNMAIRDLAIPSHISVLYVDQEAHGDDVSAIQTVLSADVWRERLIAEDRTLSAELADPKIDEKRKDKASERLGEVHQLLIDIDAETGPARAAELLYGLGFDETDQQRATRTFSGGWRFRISLARALFVKPDLLLLDEPSNNLDLVALAWLEDYLATSWTGTLFVVSHDRSFLDATATDIVHMHSQRLDYYKGNFSQFYATKEERAKNQRKEYEAQQLYRAGLQAFIDRWRYNANRAAQAQSKIKILEKLPVLEPPQEEQGIKFTFQTADKLSPPLLQLENVSFSYAKGEKVILSGVDLDIGLDSRLGLIGPNGAGKSTLLKLLIGENEPTSGKVNRNGRLKVAYFAQHQVDALDLTVSPVAYLASKFPGQSEQEYRAQLGHFGITGLTGLQLMSTLSGGQKSRVAFAALSMLRPHILVLDEPTNHLDIEAHDALSSALNRFNGGVLIVSHDKNFIDNTVKELWMVQDGAVKKHYGSVDDYKQLILKNAKMKPN